MKHPTETELNDMMPRTIHNLPALAVLSALQKAIRRSEERLAMELACELIHTSPAYTTMVTNRLMVIAHEDIDALAAPHVVPFVAASAPIVGELRKKKPENPGGARMVVGNMIRVLCAAPKSRAADHFQAAIGLASLLDDHAPVIPDWAFDMHTQKGRQLGRGLDHFREVGTKLINPDGSEPSEDEYANEAYAMWKKRDADGAKLKLRKGKAA